MSTPSVTDRDPREDRIRDLDSQRRAFLLAHPGTHTRAFGDEDVAYLLALAADLRAERDRLRDVLACEEAVARDPSRKGDDGTERLCRALYGRKAQARDYLGGSEARMLHDAARLIGNLREKVEGLAARVAAQSELLSKRAERGGVDFGIPGGPQGERRVQRE